MGNNLWRSHQAKEQGVWMGVNCGGVIKRCVRQTAGRWRLSEWNHLDTILVIWLILHFLLQEGALLWMELLCCCFFFNQEGNWCSPFRQMGEGREHLLALFFSSGCNSPKVLSPRDPYAAVLGPWWGSFHVDAPLGRASPSDQTIHVHFRIKKVLMPSVPDPKFSFLGLFESHQGNFQVSSISLCKLALGGPNITPLQYFILFFSA